MFSLKNSRLTMSVQQAKGAIDKRIGRRSLTRRVKQRQPSARSNHERTWWCSARLPQTPIYALAGPRISTLSAARNRSDLP
jgi:hypothetical protein